MKANRLSPILRVRRRLILAVLCVVTALSNEEACVKADHYGYEFRPGPHVPPGFKPGPGVDASGMDLSASVFVGMGLGNARFDGSNLQQASFHQVRFDSGGASFRGADLRNATVLESGDFAACDFSDALINGLSFIKQQDHLTIEQLRSTRSYNLKDLSGCQIVGGLHERGNYDYITYRTLRVRDVALDFRGFDLRGAMFVAGDFTRCDFRGSIITGATFVRSKIALAQIRSTNQYTSDPVADRTTGGAYANPARRLVPRDGCAGLGFSLVDFRGWDFRDADLRGARFHEADLDGVSLAGADISGAEFWKSITREQLVSTKSYQDGNLTGTVFVWHDFSHFDFSGQNLTGTRFVYCDIREADFTDAVITGAELRYLDYPPTVEQIQSTWNFKHGRTSGIALPKELRAALHLE